MWQQQDWVSLLKPLADAGHLDAFQPAADVLRTAGRPASAGDVGLLKQLGDCLLQAQQWPQALDAYKAALALLAGEQQQQQEQAQESPQHQAGQPQEQSQQQPSQQPQEQAEQQQELEEQSQRQQQQQRQQAPQQQARDQQPQQPLNSISLQACCAAALYPQGGPHAEAALHLLHAVLTDPQGRNLPAALRLCAQAAADQQRWPAAAAAAVRLLAQLPSDKEGIRVLAQAAQNPSGMQALQEAVLQRDAGSAAGRAGVAAPAEAAAAVAAPGAPAALCFLAHTLLTQGVVQPSVQLYHQAMQLNPGCSRCALGLAQALEVQCDYAGVLQVVLGFCNSNPKQQLRPLLLQTLAEVPALQQLSREPFQLGSLQWYHQQQQHSVPSSMQFSEQGAQTRRHTDQKQQPAYQQEVCGSQKEGQPEPDHHQLCCNGLQALHITPSQVQQDAPKQATASPVATGQLASSPAAVAAEAAGEAGEACHSQSSLGSAQQACDLTALALIITAAKVLFCGGALWAARQLLQLLLPVEQAAAAVQPLQHSSIRNEAAYAALLRKLLAEDPAAAWSKPGSGVKPEMVYVCGDSHVLPIAWRKVTLEGCEHLMVPLLITGCKVWHLRPDSTHPCARQLEAAVAAVPPGSKVLMVLGEIDCREGLLTAVAKRKYGCLEDAVAATVCVYVNALLQLAQGHALQQLWVHCVPPALPETRRVVQLFNSTLQQQLALQGRDMQPAQAQGRSSNVPVRFLDLEGRLLSGGQWLCFDGTHLHPGYVQELLQAAMACNSQ